MRQRCRGKKKCVVGQNVNERTVCVQKVGRSIVRPSQATEPEGVWERQESNIPASKTEWGNGEKGISVRPHPFIPSRSERICPLHVPEQRPHGSLQDDVRRGRRWVSLRGGAAADHQVDGASQQRQGVAQSTVVALKQELV